MPRLQLSQDGTDASLCITTLISIHFVKLAMRFDGEQPDSNRFACIKHRFHFAILLPCQGIFISLQCNVYAKTFRTFRCAKNFHIANEMQASKQ